MKKLCIVILCLVTATEVLCTIDTGVTLNDLMEVDSDDIIDGIMDLDFSGLLWNNKEHKRRVYSKWSRWSACLEGHKTRRKHCLKKSVCGGAMRIEVAKCKRSHRAPKAFAKRILEREHSKPRERIIGVNMHQRRQLENDDIQRRFRGFSPWSPWSSCSKKCTTVRRRECRVGRICGRKIVSQSAYCYLEGSYCHNWIRTRMQRRKDPEYTTDIQEEWMPPPAPAFHPEDTRVTHTRPPECGRLGHYWSYAARMKARMQNMIRIIGGRPAPPGKWPWQVVLLNQYKEAFCGGTLISLRWVVTAAHCVRRKLFVRLGEHDLMVKNLGEVEMRVTEAIIHPRYDSDTVINDVAMLRLPYPALPQLGHGLACLPRPDQNLAPHTTCVILGWGKKRASDIHGARILQEAQVSTVQQSACRRSYWQYAITDNMVCAGRGRRDSCAGDSGGPLLCRDQDMRFYLQGITSFGDGCGKRGKYGIYTRTAGYVEWMREVMDKKYFD